MRGLWAGKLTLAVVTSFGALLLSVFLVIFSDRLGPVGVIVAIAVLVNGARSAILLYRIAAAT